MTSILTNVYIDELADIANKYNNTYHNTIKIKSFHVKSSTCIDANVKDNDKDSQFNFGNRVRISKYKNIFAKGYVPNWSEQVFVIKNVKDTVPCTYLINDFKDEEIVGKFYEKRIS